MPAAKSRSWRRQKNARGNASENEHVHSQMHCRGHFSIFRTVTSFVPTPIVGFPLHNGWQEGGGRYQINQLSQSQRNPMGRYPWRIQVIWTEVVSMEIYRWRTGVRHKYKISIILFRVLWLAVDSCMRHCSVLSATHTTWPQLCRGHNRGKIAVMTAESQRHCRGHDHGNASECDIGFTCRSPIYTTTFLLGIDGPTTRSRQRRRG